MKKISSFTSGLLVLLLAFSFSAHVLAASAVDLGSASSFAVLAGSAITNTGPSVLNGSLGLSPGTSVTGFPPGMVNGTQEVTNAMALQAQADLATAYDAARAQGAATTVSGDLGGQTLLPGVYRSASSLALTGTLTLDAGGDPNAIFIFQAGSSLTTASGSRVTLTNGAQACNVYWAIGSSATLGTTSSLSGSVLALTSVTLNTNASVAGRVLARNGAVTLDSNVVSIPACTVAQVIVVPPVTATTTGSVTATSTPVVATSTPLIATTTPPALPPLFIGVVSVQTPIMPNTGGHLEMWPLFLSLALLGVAGPTWFLKLRG